MWWRFNDLRGRMDDLRRRIDDSRGRIDDSSGRINDLCGQIDSLRRLDRPVDDFLKVIVSLNNHAENGIQILIVQINSRLVT